MDVTIHPHRFTAPFLPSPRSRWHTGCSSRQRFALYHRHQLQRNLQGTSMPPSVAWTRLAHASRARAWAFRVVPLPGTSATDNIRQATPGAYLDCGESGSTLRFMLPVVAALGRGGSSMVTAAWPSAPSRPSTRSSSAMASRSPRAGSFPSRSRARSCRAASPSPECSSQFVSGLLMAAPLLSAPSEIVVTEPVESRSYIRLYNSLARRVWHRRGCDARDC